jgi:hypothetical protein
LLALLVNECTYCGDDAGAIKGASVFVLFVLVKQYNSTNTDAEGAVVAKRSLELTRAESAERQRQEQEGGGRGGGWGSRSEGQGSRSSASRPQSQGGGSRPQSRGWGGGLGALHVESEVPDRLLLPEGTRLLHATYTIYGGSTLSQRCLIACCFLKVHASYTPLTLYMGAPR